MATPARSLGLALLVLAIGLAGCGAPDSDGDATPSASASTSAVRPTEPPTSTAESSPAALPSATPAAAAKPPQTSLTPAELALGPPPEVPYVDPATGLMHVGDATVAVPDGVTPVGRVVAVAGGGIVTGMGFGRAAVRIGSDGVRQLPRIGGRSMLASASGTTFATSTGTTVSIRRTVDARVVHTRDFGSDEELLGVALLQVDDAGALLRLSRGLARWSFDDDRVTLLAPAAAVPLLAAPAGERVVLATRGGDGPSVVAGLPISDAPWTLPRGFQARAFSPDGRYLLLGRTSATDPRGDDEYDDPLRVVDAATGRPMRDFTGTGFGWYAQGGPWWVGPSTFLTLTRPDGGASTTQPLQWVRCTVAGACERVGPLVEVLTDHLRPGPYVVAHRTSPDEP